MQVLRLAGQKGIQLLFEVLMSDEGKQDLVSAGRTRVILSEELFGGRKEIHIRHRDAVYRLFITRQGKLILNK